MSHVFATKADALAAGYRLPSTKAGDRDVSPTMSGSPTEGYQFESADGSRTVDVTFTVEPNRLGSPGSYAPMFAPGDCQS